MGAAASDRRDGGRARLTAGAAAITYNLQAAGTRRNHADHRGGAGGRVQGGRNAVPGRPSRRRIGRADGGRPPARHALHPDQAGGRGRHAGLDLGRDHGRARGVPVDAGPWRRQHGERHRARLPRQSAADRDHRPLCRPGARGRAAPAARPARHLRPDREVGHHDRCPHGAPAGAPRAPHRDRTAARARAVRPAAERDHQGRRSADRRAAAAAHATSTPSPSAMP